MRRSLLGLALLASFSFACGPLAMIPGGKISGTPKPLPSDWRFTDAIDDVVIETNPADPYSVTVWGVGIGADFYVVAADRESPWAENLRRDPRVRLKIEDAIYELQATAIEDPEELERFLTAAHAKYDFEADEEQRAGAQLFRLGPRSP